MPADSETADPSAAPPSSRFSDSRFSDSNISDSGDPATAAPTAPSRFSDAGNEPQLPSSPPNSAALGRSALVGERVAQQPPAPVEQQPIGSGLPTGPAPLHSLGTGPAPLAASDVGASIRRGGLGDGTQLEGAARPGAKSLDGPQTPSIMIEKFAPAEIQVGKPAKFDIKVQNVGQATAENVVVRDEVPQGTRLIESTPQASVGENEALYWQVGVLRPGEEKTVSMQVMPVGEGEIGSVATVTFSAQASARTTSTRPQLLLECTAPRQVMIGQSLKLNIRLSNPGTGAATNVVLEEDVPDGLVHAAGTALEFEAGTLKPGETRELELTVAAAKAGVVQNVIRARADANLSVKSTADIEVIAPSLAVDVAGPSKRYLEREATHEVIISNPGTAPAKNVEMVAHLPKGLKFVSANNQGQYDGASHAVYWSLEQLNANDKGSVELTTMPIEAGQQKIRVESKADMDLSTAQEHVVAVEGLAALFFEVADAADPIEVGGETIYEIRVINQGTKTSTNIRVSAALPPGLKPLEAGGATGGVITGQQVGFEPLARLAPKADALYRIRVQGVEKGNQQINVQLSSDEIPPFNKEESTRVYADE